MDDLAERSGSLPPIASVPANSGRSLYPVGSPRMASPAIAGDPFASILSGGVPELTGRVESASPSGPREGVDHADQSDTGQRRERAADDELAVAGPEHQSPAVTSESAGSVAPAAASQSAVANRTTADSVASRRDSTAGVAEDPPQDGGGPTRRQSAGEFPPGSAVAPRDGAKPPEHPGPAADGRPGRVDQPSHSQEAVKNRRAAVAQDTVADAERRAAVQRGTDRPIRFTRASDVGESVASARSETTTTERTLPASDSAAPRSAIRTAIDSSAMAGDASDAALPTGNVPTSDGSDSAAPTRPSAAPAIDGSQSMKLIRRVAQGLGRLGPEGGVIRLRLAPAELGTVRVEMRIHGRSLDARIVADTEAASSLLREHLVDLRSRLESFGMQIERIEVDVEAGDDLSRSRSLLNPGDQETNDRRQQSDGGNQQDSAAVSQPVSQPRPVPGDPSPGDRPVAVPPGSGVDLQL